jgi:ABC-type xylose transport system permease subunit
MIVTLGGLFFYRGVIYVWTGGTVNSLNAGAQTHWVTQLFGGLWFLELVNSFWWFLLVAAILSFVLTRTRYGNHLFAIGGDPDSAKTRGVNANRVKLISFVLCSFLAGLGGIMTLANDPNTHVTIGQDLELQAIAAAVIGGVHWRWQRSIGWPGIRCFLFGCSFRDDCPRRTILLVHLLCRCLLGAGSDRKRDNPATIRSTLRIVARMM